MEAALTLPGGVYNFGSENTKNMVLTARQFAETLGITVDIQKLTGHGILRWIAASCGRRASYLTPHRQV